MLLEKLRYLTTGADTVVFAGSLPRGVDDGLLRRDDPRPQPPRRQDDPRLRGRAASPGHERRAVPRLAEPARGGEPSSARSSTRSRTSSSPSTRSQSSGARNVLITQESGCFALFREDRELKRYRAIAPRVEPVSTVGSGDALLAGVPRRSPCREAARRGAARGCRGGRRVDARGRRRPLRPARGRAAWRAESRWPSSSPLRTEVVRSGVIRSTAT